MRCYICNYCSTTGSDKEPDLLDSTSDRNVYRQKDGKDVCGSCLKDIRKTSYGFTDVLADVKLLESSDIDDMLRELEERIPDIFVGKVCPGNGGCSCTYQTGCKALKYKENKNY